MDIHPTRLHSRLSVRHPLTGCAWRCGGFGAYASEEAARSAVLAPGFAPQLASQESLAHVRALIEHQIHRQEGEEMRQLRSLQRQLARLEEKLTPAPHD